MKKEYFTGAMIEPTNICNLRCPLCLTGANFSKRPKGNMNLSQFEKIISPLKDFLKQVNLWGFGEPFLAPDILKMMDFLGRNDIVVNIHTNASFLNRNILDHFKKNYKARVTFSIDGITQKSYSYYRKGGNLKKAMANMSYLVGLKKKYNLDNIRIIWQFMVMRTNEGEIESIEHLAKKTGVDRLKLKTISVSKRSSLYNDFMPEKAKYRRERSKVVNFAECGFINPGMPNVSWNGDVIPCCHDYLQECVMGNAFRESILDIWDNKKYRKFRRDYRNGINHLCNTKCKFTKKSKIYVKEIDFN